jgi:hypothetical protein
MLLFAAGNVAEGRVSPTPGRNALAVLVFDLRR